MSTPRPTRPLARWMAVAAAVLLAAGCSTPQDTADQPDEVVGQPQQAEGPADPEAPSPDQPAQKPQLPSADERADDQVPAASAEAGSTELDASAKRELEDALQMAHNGQTDSAMRRLSELAGRPNGFLAAYNLGVIYEGQADYGNAARRYTQALQKNPDFAPALKNLLRLYLRLDQVSDADKIARKYVNERPENMDLRAAALEIALHKGKYEDVIRGAKEILRREENNANAMLAMAEANLHLERYELATAVLDVAVKLRPNNPEIFFKYGAIRMANDQSPNAIKSFEKAVELRPNYPEARNNLGVLYMEARDYEAAAQQLRAAVKGAPEYKEAFLNLGNAYKGLGQFRQAAEAFKQALKIDPKYADAYFNLGVLHLDSKIEGMNTIPRLQQAIDYFTKYKSVAGSAIGKDDPVNKYVQEAQKNIDNEKARQEMMRQAQMQAEQPAAGGSEEAEGADGQDAEQ